jgi:hypothetical protein
MNAIHFRAPAMLPVHRKCARNYRGNAAQMRAEQRIHFFGNP